MGEQNDIEKNKPLGGAAPTAPPVDEPTHLPIPDDADAIIKVADRDIKEEVLDIPEWGYAVKLRSFTAAQQATIRQIGFQQTEGGVSIHWAMMEIAQLQMGVIQPTFSEPKAKQLHMKSGKGFQRIIKWLDENSGLDKKALEEVKEQFPGSEQPAEA